MTTFPDQGRFPQVSDGQYIGKLAQTCFIANHPLSWFVGDCSGDADFGIDYSVQVAQSRQQVRQITQAFKVQLKGTEKPELNASGEFFSIQLSASTVRYYQNTTEPILLVLADISVDPSSPKNCPLYYVWIDEELKRQNSQDGTGMPPDQKYISLRVPKKNVLENNTDLTQELGDKIRIAKAGDAFHALVERERPDFDRSAQIVVLENIPKAISNRGPVFFDALVDDDASLWPEPKIDSLPWYLGEGVRLLKIGKVAEAEAMLLAARNQEDQASAAELGEMFYIEGRIQAFRSNDLAARDLYAQAMEVSPQVPKHVASWAEMELRMHFDYDADIDYSDILSKLESADPLVVSVKVRILAAEKKYGDAISLANSMQNRDKFGGLATIYVMSSQFDKAIAACDEGLMVLPLREYDKQLLILLRARAKFYLATDYVGRGNPDAVYPLTGTPKTDMALLKEAWDDTLIIVDLLRAGNWPPNTEFVSDFWPAIASVLNKQSEALPLMREAAQARPESIAMQYAVETIAMQCQNYAVALEANAQQPESNAVILRRLHLLHLSKKDSDFVELLTAKIETLEKEEFFFGTILAMGTISAERIVRSDLARQWEEILASTPSLAEDYAIQKYFSDIKRNLLVREDALKRLEENYEKLGRPIYIGIHMFHELDAMIKEQAGKIVEIAARLEEEKRLGLDSLSHLAQAFATLGRWPELLELSTRSLQQFENHERFRGIEALALDRMGRSVEALSSLQRLIDAGIDDPFAINTYLGIVVRSGFAESAIRLMESVISRQTKKEQRLQCMQLLFNLVRFSEPESPRCIEIFLQIGDLVDPSKEDEEGSFLAKFATIGTYSNVQIDNQKLIEINARLEIFFNNFPNSNFLKRATFPDGDDPSQILEEIKKIAGWSEDRQQHFRKIENQLRTGALPFPYAFRPRNALQNISDLPTLWEVGKRSDLLERQYHLTMALNDFVPANAAAIEGKIPLLDLTSLLILQDLELLDGLFKVFPKIAVGQATMTELNDLIRPFSGSFYRRRCQALQERLKESFSAIEQPYAATPENDDFLSRNWAAGEVQALATTGKYMLYSDDAIFRAFCQVPNEHQSCICTLDLFGMLEDKGYLSLSEIAEKVALLCSWKVGLILPNRYLLAILPAGLSHANSVKGGVDLLHASASFNNIFNSIWDIAQPYVLLQANIGTLGRELLLDGTMSSHHVAAFVVMWHAKIFLRTDVKQTKDKILILVILQMAHFDPALNGATAKKLISMFNECVQFIHADHMDEQVEAAAIEELARTAAHEDVSMNWRNEKSLRARLANGFTSGTADGDRFSEAYTEAIVSIAGQVVQNN